MSGQASLLSVTFDASVRRLTACLRVVVRLSG
jgi:hypothetical protein